MVDGPSCFPRLLTATNGHLGTLWRCCACEGQTPALSSAHTGLNINDINIGLNITVGSEPRTALVCGGIHFLRIVMTKTRCLPQNEPFSCGGQRFLRPDVW